MLRLGQVDVYEINEWDCGEEDGPDIRKRKFGKLQNWEDVELR